MAETIKMSAKELGTLALTGFCPRCFWLRKMRHNKLPYQTFPSIFSVIDGYTKDVVHAYFDKYGAAPPYLSELGELTGYQEPPHHSNFQVYDEASNITLCGSPDAVFTRPDGSYIIGDYKTARHKGDALLPLYVVQLTVYAYLGERNGLKPVSGISLIYAEPLTDEAAVKSEFTTFEEGFRLSFKIKTMDLTLDTSTIPPLLMDVRRIMDEETCPVGKKNCRDCANVDALIAAANTETVAAKASFRSGFDVTPDAAAVMVYAGVFGAS